MKELVTLSVTDNDELAQNFSTILAAENLKSIHVKSINDALTLLKSKTENITTILFEIPAETAFFERDLRRFNKNKEAKYIPFIGIQTVQTPEPAVSRQLFFHILNAPDYELSLGHTIISAQSDYKRYQALLSEVKSRTSAIGLINAGKFRLQTLHQAEALTTMLSLACPEPAVVALGLSELLVNAIEHGNLNITYQEKTALLENGEWDKEIEKRLKNKENKDKYVEVIFQRFEERITLSVTDHGSGFNWRDYLTADAHNLTEKHGRGIAIAIAMGFSNLKYNEKGNEVTATIEL